MGPFPGSPSALLLFSVHFSSRNSSFSDAEAPLLLMDGTKQGLVQLQGLSVEQALSHQCSLELGWGKIKPELSPLLGVLLEPFPAKQFLILFLGPSLLVVRPNLARQLLPWIW